MAGPSPKDPRESRDLCYDFRPASPPSASASPLTVADVAHFNERGFTPPITVFAGPQLEALQATFEEHASGYPRPAGEPFRAFHPEDRGLYDVLSNPTTVAAVQTLVGSDNVVVHISQFVDKPPDPQRAPPGRGASLGQEPDAAGRSFGESQSIFHQDASFNAVDAGSIVCWLAIADADVENGCMWALPTSHLVGLQPCNSSHHVLSTAEFGEAVPLPAKAGQAIFLSDLLMHSSPPNPHPTRSRPAFTATYAAAEQEPLRHAEPAPHRFAVLVSGEDRHNNWEPLPPPPLVVGRPDAGPQPRL